MQNFESNAKVRNFGRLVAQGDESSPKFWGIKIFCDIFFGNRFRLSWRHRSVSLWRNEKCLGKRNHEGANSLDPCQKVGIFAGLAPLLHQMTLNDILRPLIFFCEARHCTSPDILIPALPPKSIFGRATIIWPLTLAKSIKVSPWHTMVKSWFFSLLADGHPWCESGELPPGTSLTP